MRTRTGETIKSSAEAAKACFPASAACPAGARSRIANLFACQRRHFLPHCPVLLGRRSRAFATQRQQTRFMVRRPHRFSKKRGKWRVRNHTVTVCLFTEVFTKTGSHFYFVCRALVLVLCGRRRRTLKDRPDGYLPTARRFHYGWRRSHGYSG